ncbi:MAG: hypothetical protein ABUK01_15325 [Leptospirales bacterium]
MKKNILITSLAILAYTWLAIPLFAQDGTTESADSKNEATNPDGEIEESEMSYFNKDEMEFLTGEKEFPWNFGRITLGTDYMFPIGQLKNTLSYQGGIMLAFDHGLHHLFKPFYKRKSAFIPGLRLEFNYNFYGPVQITSFAPRGGLLWLFPLDKEARHNIILSGTVGMSFMTSDDPDFTDQFANNALSIGAELGYQLFLSDIFISITGRFHYISDSTYPWMGVGGQIAMGYRFTNDVRYTGDTKTKK